VTIVASESREMPDQEEKRSEMIFNRDSRSVEDAFAPPADTGGESLLSLTAQEARAILAGAQERAAIEAENFWEQADEACSVDPIG
jgi:hypothetical protein